MAFSQGRPLGPMTTQPIPGDGNGNVDGNGNGRGKSRAEVAAGEGELTTGTRITFTPDPSIFKSTVHFDFDKVYQ